VKALLLKASNELAWTKHSYGPVIRNDIDTTTQNPLEVALILPRHTYPGYATYTSFMLCNETG